MKLLLILALAGFIAISLNSVEGFDSLATGNQLNMCDCGGKNSKCCQGDNSEWACCNPKKQQCCYEQYNCGRFSPCYRAYCCDKVHEDKLAARNQLNKGVCGDCGGKNSKCCQGDNSEWQCCNPKKQQCCYEQYDCGMFVPCYRAYCCDKVHEKPSPVQEKADECGGCGDNEYCCNSGKYNVCCEHGSFCCTKRSPCTRFSCDKTFCCKGSRKFCSCKNENCTQIF